MKILTTAASTMVTSAIVRMTGKLKLFADSKNKINKIIIGSNTNLELSVFLRVMLTTLRAHVIGVKEPWGQDQQ